MDAYPLPARPLPVDSVVAPRADLRGTPVDTDGLDGLSPWLWCIEYVRRAVAAGRADVARRLVEDTIKAFDRNSGTTHQQLDAVLEALDNDRPVAIYGWWPTPGLAAVTDILGVDAMEVPTPDRKGRGLTDGHAVVAVGYGRHDAFPGGGYVIVRNPWRSGWGDDGIGYLPFTYVRTCAIALRTYRLDRNSADGATTAAADPIGKALGIERHPVDALIAKRARCADPRSTYAPLFFSENPLDTARAKAICARCTVRDPCLSRALDRKEPYGVWGGEFVLEGKVIAVKRGRGRPRKVPLPTLVDEVTGVPIVA